jgi:hypothetical protein
MGPRRPLTSTDTTGLAWGRTGVRARADIPCEPGVDFTARNALRQTLHQRLCLMPVYAHQST